MDCIFFFSGLRFLFGGLYALFIGSLIKPGTISKAGLGKAETCGNLLRWENRGEGAVFGETASFDPARRNAEGKKSILCSVIEGKVC